MQATPTSAAATRKVFEVLMAVKIGAEVAADVDAVPLATEAAVKAVPATADGTASAPMAAAMVMVKIAVGPVRDRTVSIKPDIRSRNISRPRARRCFTASSLMSSATATARTD